ncbi:hypothetical protein ANANG_G00209940 [Anguilla anguilla]|uniref:C2 domain-containing protein n=1 Tax=Anguilla anguilla TaxID=7936 RepID=A0A9D3RUD3_ANGAN|nr:hypothetical protein ANANG_G00209940 [Anguilla anguilla]
MVVSAAAVLGAALGTASGVLTLCGLSLLCRSCREKRSEKDPEPDAEKQSVLHSSQQFSIEKSTESIQPRTLLEFPKIYAPTPSVTSPEVVNPPESVPDATGEPTAKGDPAAKPERGNLATEGPKEVFAVQSQDSTEETPCAPERKNGLIKSPSLLHPKLHFSLKYCPETKELHVTVIEADRVSTGAGGEGYVEGRLSTAAGQKEARTSSRHLAAHVRWEEELVLGLPGGQEKEEEDVEGEVALSLHSCDRFSRQANLGTVRFKLADVGMMSDADCWVDLQPPKKDVCISAGEILLSISYLPAANRLGVVVMKARGLQSDKLKDTIDLSVKLALKHQATKLRKKQTRRVKHKMNPVWNEMLMLEVPRELLARSSLELEVLNQAGGVGGQASTMGRCQLGLQAPATGLQHWQQMLDNPRKQIAMWHPLYA